MTLLFDAPTHRYTWNGVRIPSVTQCLEPLFDWSKVPRDMLERKRRIGIAVHAAIHLEITGGVDERTIAPAVKPYFQGWRRFCSECRFEPVLTEFQIYNDEVRGPDGLPRPYAGTLDDWGFLQGYPSLIDWKTSLILNYQAVGSQTAAYLKGLVRIGIGSLSDRRYALKLGADGRYKLEPYRNLEDDWLRFVRYLRQWQPNQVVMV
jgi:hypothetical protein